MNRAEIFLLKGDPAAAAKALEELAAQTSDPAAWQNLGAVYARMGRWKDALRAWSQAIAADPGDVETRLLLADYYSRIEPDPDRARFYLEQARLIDPDHPRLRELMKQR
jgi:tetratricopeptide (TPR) repeat protein